MQSNSPCVSTRSTVEDGFRAAEWRILPRRRMPPTLYVEAVALCSEAYEEDYAAQMDEHGADSVHLLGFENGGLVTHALWVPCSVEAGTGTPMRAACVEALATRPARQGRGLGSAATRRLVEEIATAGFDLAVLWASNIGWYTRLGWERWRGPVSQRRDGIIEPLPDDDVMIHRLPRTPALDPAAPLLITGEAQGR